MVGLKADKNQKLKLSAKSEFCCEGKENYIQKIISFEFQTKSYLGIARKSGLVQLFEQTNGIHQEGQNCVRNSKGKSYKLYKNWKHSNMNSEDQIIDIGFFKDRYLYSCSIEGKLIFRDLINDDANESYKVFLIQNPVNCIAIRNVEDDYGVIENGSFTIAAAGKNNELKLYKVCLDENEVGRTIRGRCSGISRIPPSINNFLEVEGDDEDEGDEDDVNEDVDQDDDDDDDNDRLNEGAVHDNEVDDADEEGDDDDEEDDDADVEDHDSGEGSDTDVVLVSFHQGFPIIEFSRRGTSSVSRTTAPSTTLPFQSFSTRPYAYHYVHYSDVLRRHITSFNLNSTNSINNERKISTLIPHWTSRTAYKDFLYLTTLADKVFNWIISVRFVPDKPDIILCGTQFGEIFVYNTKRSKFPIKRISLSQFGITKIEIFQNQNCQYLAYTDAMSKVGILNFHTFQQVNYYEGIHMGPISSSLFIFPPARGNYSGRKLHKLSSSSNFEPIIFITSTIEKKLLIYKLFNNNTKRLVNEMNIDTLIPSLYYTTTGDLDESRIYELFANNREKRNVDTRNLLNSQNIDYNFESNTPVYDIELLDNEVKRQNSTPDNTSPLTMVDLNEYVVKNPSPLRYELNDHKKRMR